jgi:cell division protein FtsQ
VVILAAAIIVLYLLFSKETICKEIAIEIINDSEQIIIDKADVKAIILSEYKNIIGASIDIVDLADLEQKIEYHPSVKNAEVFKRHTGTLTVKIEQRIPIIRVMPVKGPDFYIDTDGHLMPTTDIGSARVMVANGSINFIYTGKDMADINDTTMNPKIVDLFKTAECISKDPFLNAQIEQLYIKQDGEIELIPKVGNHIVLLGDVINCEKKLKYLKHFYLNVMNEVGWRTYSYLNLKFEGQIIGTRRKS